ncbi:Hypothetical predicted protein [Xyrichtys novacula]|uniref:Uncharacterized protein n=1 Tax=Xyrichtys novacula TaxID=13765 RepID=A0AAV1EMK9_XYRNO|nr:Hypothetical predicted protein [Xyrichtys novacula]
MSSHKSSAAHTDNTLFTAAAVIVKWSVCGVPLFLFLFTVDMQCLDSSSIWFVSTLEVLVSRHPLMRSYKHTRILWQYIHLHKESILQPQRKVDSAM